MSDQDEVQGTDTFGGGAGCALMILALDDDVPARVEAAIRDQEAVLDLWIIRLGGER